MEALSNFSIKKGKVSKTAGTNLTFEGTEHPTKETLVLLFSDVNNKTATIKIDNHPANTPIVILPEQVNHLAVGKGNVYLVKKQTIQAQSATTELTGLTEYYSAVVFSCILRSSRFSTNRDIFNISLFRCSC